MFFKGELLHGCMDKAQYGKFGLVHAVQVRFLVVYRKISVIHVVDAQEFKSALAY